MSDVPISTRLILATPTSERSKTIIEICQETGLAPITVQRGLQRLVRTGLVLREFRPHHSATYALAPGAASNVI